MQRGYGAKGNEGSASFGARHPSKTGVRDDPHVTGQTGSVPCLSTAIVRGLGCEEGRTYNIWGGVGVIQDPIRPSPIVRPTVIPVRWRAASKNVAQRMAIEAFAGALYACA